MVISTVQELYLLSLFTESSFTVESDELYCVEYEFTWCEHFKYDISQPDSSIRVTCAYEQQEDVDFSIGFSKSLAACSKQSYNALSIFLNGIMGYQLTPGKQAVVTIGSGWDNKQKSPYDIVEIDEQTIIMIIPHTCSNNKIT
ncbi:unnamed protein product [Adineta ricciae]|uniref:Uncharacterized protein n=1 Tax=Adineta ricciae TaxID=249248 RepID=A0A815IXQ0_ADIRI|nr:unnamed protein product [Adineta ricciae]